MEKDTSPPAPASIPEPSPTTREEEEIAQYKAEVARLNKVIEDLYKKFAYIGIIKSD